jgi:L-fucose isomerase-like protein
MKARIVPVYFEGRDEDFDIQLGHLNTLLADEAEILAPVPLGGELPDAEAVVFPQFLGEAYRRIDDFKAIDLPILVITSEFGTFSMWDWELITYLRLAGVDTVVPYNLEQTIKICRALSVKRELKSTKFLVFQDTPGGGMQASIFKRFYWFENEAIQRMLQKFGIELVYKSFKEFGAAAQEIPDEEADAVIAEKEINIGNITDKQLRSAIKVYMMLKREVEADPSIRSVGINCLNESYFSDSTPCLAWSLLYDERKLMWGCEGDIMTMITEYILHKSFGMPIMMTNLYPFLMGQAALKHERIPYFPEVEGPPEDHILAAHCGYFGVVPQSMSSQWTLRSKVLAMVDDNAIALDARLPEGPMTLAKLKPGLNQMMVIEGELEKYTQFEDSDCLNGAVLRVSDGKKLVPNLSSHHYLLMTGHNLDDIKLLGQLFDIEIEVM